MDDQDCSIEKCGSRADFDVLLEDVYQDGEVFCEVDFTCPRLCRAHRDENERGAIGLRDPRGLTSYPFSNRQRAQGYTTYRTRT